MTSATVVQMMDKFDRKLFLIHALRHLLDHSPDRSMVGWIQQTWADTEAMDILLAAHDAVEEADGECWNCEGSGSVPRHSSTTDLDRCEECRGKGRI